MKQSAWIHILLVAVVALVSGCSHRIGDLTLITTKNVDISRMGEYQRVGSRVEGKHSQHFFLSIPVSSPANIEEAADRAIEAVPGGVALIDAVITVGAWSVILYGQRSFYLEGEVLVDPNIAPAR